MVSEYRKRADDLSNKFAKIEKRKHSIANLSLKNSANFRNKNNTWRPCCYIGIPCSSRMPLALTPLSSHKGKELIFVCSEKSVCIHSLAAVATK